jgi:ribosomal protein S21
MGYKKRVIKGTFITGTKVEVKHNKIELALKKFKNKVKDANIMLELREKKYYKKKSDRKREKKNLAKIRQKYKQEKEKNYH